MRVSAVMPVFNGERYLAEALDSVIAQARPADEIIIVDDGSTDASAAIVARYRNVRHVYQPNAGCAAARNRGVGEATGDVVAFIDQDDLWMPDHLARMTDVLRGDGEIAFAACAVENFLSPDVPFAPADFDPLMLKHPQHGMGTNTLVVRRNAFARVGPFDVSMVPIDDSDWLLRAIDAGLRFVHLDQPSVRRRIHAGNQSTWTRSSPPIARLMARSLHASIQRRRVSP